jgi:hypothetical protein
MKTRMRIAKLLVLVLTSLIYVGCTEVPPRINYDPEIPLLKDTVYTVNPVPPAQDRNAVIEDITGIRCVNCPDAAETAKGIKDGKDEGRVVLVAIHPISLGFFTAPLEGDSFNTQEGEDIVQNLIGVPRGLPSGPVNRIKFDGENEVTLPPAKWSGYVSDVLSQKASVNLDVELTPLKETRSAVINIKSTFLQQDETQVNLTVMLLEDKIIGHQYTIDGKVDDYLHEHIFRETITPYSGIRLAESVTPGTVIEKGFSFEVPEGFEFDNCSVVVMINKVDDENKEVLQVKELKLKN